MDALQAIKALGPIDVKSVRRDPLLRWMIVYPLFMALLIRWGAPPMVRRLLLRFQFDLVPYYPLLLSIVLLMTGMLAGIVIGFLLLDQKDDQTLTALQVTPLSSSGYLIYRVTVPMLLSGAVTLVVLPITGLLRIDFIPLLLATLCAAPLAPFYALSLAALASNKVQGFALTKAMGVLLLLPVLAYFTPAPWQWAFGLAPTFWPAKLFWLLDAGGAGYGACLAIGLLYQCAVVGALLRRFSR
jgi:fluoroquinolone transport system permease protein